MDFIASPGGLGPVPEGAAGGKLRDGFIPAGFMWSLPPNIAARYQFAQKLHWKHYYLYPFEGSVKTTKHTRNHQIG